MPAKLPACRLPSCARLSPVPVQYRRVIAQQREERTRRLGTVSQATAMPGKRLEGRAKLAFTDRMRCFPGDIPWSTCIVRKTFSCVNCSFQTLSLSCIIGKRILVGCLSGFSFASGGILIELGLIQAPSWSIAVVGRTRPRSRGPAAPIIPRQ